jgi:hypothetical protein
MTDGTKRLLPSQHPRTTGTLAALRHGSGGEYRTLRISALRQQNPLTGCSTIDGDYQTYLYEIQCVFAAVASLLQPEGHAVVNVANPVSDGVITSLAWDIAHDLRSLDFAARGICLSGAARAQR